MQRKPKSQTFQGLAIDAFGSSIYCVEFQIILIDSVKALDDVKLIAVRAANPIEPCRIVKARCIHYENVAVPTADGIAVGGRDVLGMRATVGESMADGMVMLVKQHVSLGVLYHLHRNRLEVDPGESPGASTW